MKYKGGRMKEALKRYRKTKVKTKRVDFYISDYPLLQYVESINFSKFVKNKIREQINNGKQDL